MTDATVLPFRPRADAPIQKPEFGKRKAGSALGDAALAAFAIARDADTRQKDRIKALAREARNALDGRAVDPELVRDLAIEVGHVAQQCEQLACKAKSWGALKAAVSLREHAHLLETLSAELTLQAEERP